MGIIRYDARINVLLSVKGHPYERDAFMALFEEMEDIAITAVEQPAAASLMTPEGTVPYDVLMLYDMPGIDFRHPDAPRFVAPEPCLCDGLNALLQQGKGVVALHHAIAGWPLWEGYGELLGGRFLYKPAELRGAARPDSGYRHDVTHTVRKVAAAAHSILDGVPESFTLTDELYLYEVFEDDVIPLLRSSYDFVSDNFYSASQAVAGKMNSNEGWQHAPGSDLVGWVKRAHNSPLVYLQFGDGPQAYAHEAVRKLIENAIRWAASPEALAWAAQGRRP